MSDDIKKLMDELADADGPTKPSDDELLSLIANHYSVSEDTAMEWLVEMVIFNTAAEAAGGE